MKKKSKYKKVSEKEFLAELESSLKMDIIPEKYYAIMLSFFHSYKKAIESSNDSIQNYTHLFIEYLDLVKDQFQNPFIFKPYHQKIRNPFDYYRFGVDFTKPLVNKELSLIKGSENLKEITQLLKKGENVIFLANHQTEIDPQLISILLEDSFPELGEKIIYVAGERVVTDPLAIPFSMGCDLLCIYSKKYINNPPEKKSEKHLHNKRTMQLMSALLTSGVKAIYVAPSGGRDRAGKNNIIEVAPFDFQSIEMFYLMAKRAKKPTNFYPLALNTHAILPPPETTQVELGEKRPTRCAPAHLAFGKKIDMENFSGIDRNDKMLKRKKRAAFIWKKVKEMYEKLHSKEKL